MYKNIKWFPGYVIDPETLKIIWKKGNELKPYKYPKTNTLRVSLYKNWTPTYINIKNIINELWVVNNDEFSELREFFEKREWKEIRKDGLIKKFEKFYIDDAITLGGVVEKCWRKWYYIFNPDILC